MRSYDDCEDVCDGNEFDYEDYIEQYMSMEMRLSSYVVYEGQICGAWYNDYHSPGQFAIFTLLEDKCLASTSIKYVEFQKDFVYPFPHESKDLR